MVFCGSMTSQRVVVVVDSTGRGVRDRLVNSGDSYNRCCNMVFCGWDYGLSTEKAAKLKHKNLRNEYAVRTY